MEVEKGYRSLSQAPGWVFAVVAGSKEKSLLQKGVALWRVPSAEMFLGHTGFPQALIINIYFKCKEELKCCIYNCYQTLLLGTCDRYFKLNMFSRTFHFSSPIFSSQISPPPISRNSSDPKPLIHPQLLIPLTLSVSIIRSVIVYFDSSSSSQLH